MKQVLLRVEFRLCGVKNTARRMLTIIISIFLVSTCSANVPEYISNNYNSGYRSVNTDYLLSPIVDYFPSSGAFRTGHYPPVINNAGIFEPLNFNYESPMLHNKPMHPELGYPQEFNKVQFQDLPPIKHNFIRHRV